MAEKLAVVFNQKIEFFRSSLVGGRHDGEPVMLLEIPLDTILALIRHNKISVERDKVTGPEKVYLAWSASEVEKMKRFFADEEKESDSAL